MAYYNALCNSAGRFFMPKKYCLSWQKERGINMAIKTLSELRIEAEEAKKVLNDAIIEMCIRDRAIIFSCSKVSMQRLSVVYDKKISCDMIF